MKVITLQITLPASRGRNAVTMWKAVSVRVTSSWKTLTDTARVELPVRWLVGEKQVQIDNFVQTGDPILIAAGYDGQNKNIFDGYVRQVHPGVPMVLECEDRMYLLKKQEVHKQWESVSLPALLRDILPTGMAFDADDIALGPVRLARTTAAKALQKLREYYGLVAYFQDGKLIVGKVYSRTNTTRHKINLNYDVLGEDLVFTKAEDRVLMVKATSHLADGKKVVVEVGDKGGDTVSLPFYGIEDKDVLRKHAEAEMAKLRYTGLTGSFTTYGDRFMRHNDTVELASPIYPERNGSYYLETVETVVSEAGFRQRGNLGAIAV